MGISCNGNCFSPLMPNIQCFSFSPLYNVPEKVVGKTDKIIVEEIIKRDLGVKDVKIEEVIRLDVGKEPRPILLKLNDTHTQRTVLSKAKYRHLEQIHSTKVEVAAALAFHKKSLRNENFGGML